MSRPWMDVPSLQQPEYEDVSKLEEIIQSLKAAPGLVISSEISELKALIAQAAQGTHFILQVGDCAEAFADCLPDTIHEKLRIYNLYRDLLASALQKPVILIGRVAGQFTKPRSEPFEIVNGVKVVSYKGDLVNSIDPTQRKPDPERMLQGYQHAATVFSCIAGQQNKIFTSHEALHMKFEDAFTRECSSGYMNESSHFLWIGERTRKLESGHVELLSAISNPVGVKVGPNADLEDLKNIVKKLNPANERGKVVLILRVGVSNIRTQLPEVVKMIKNENLNVAWAVDPMHANTYKTSAGVKSRRVETLVTEVLTVAEVLKDCGESLAGVHLEAAFRDVTECVGLGVEETDLRIKYETLCDPRLNVQQTQFLLKELAVKLISLS